MVNGVSVIEQAPPQDIREFKLGLWSEVSAQQKGRVTRLTHPKFGTTYLIDVTDREDPTTKDPNDKTSKAEIVGEMLEDLMENPQFQDHYAMNNGVVSLITNRLDGDKRGRVYVGVTLTDPEDEEVREITSHILHETGFQHASFYVPMSFDSSLVREYMAQEVMDAVKKSGNDDLFSDFPSVLSLGSPKIA